MPDHARTSNPTEEPMSDTTETLLTSGEVAAIFRVDPKTVARWAKAGKLTSIRTVGGHRRYPKSAVDALLSGEPAKGKRG